MLHRSPAGFGNFRAIGAAAAIERAAAKLAPVAPISQPDPGSGDRERNPLLYVDLDPVASGIRCKSAGVVPASWSGYAVALTVSR